MAPKTCLMTQRLGTSPAGLGLDGDNLSVAAAAAEVVNDSHLASTLSPVQEARILPTPPEASRVAPRPPVSRLVLPAPGLSNLPLTKTELTPLPADLRLRAKAQGPGPLVSSRSDSLSQSEQEARPQI